MWQPAGHFGVAVLGLPCPRLRGSLEATDGCDDAGDVCRMEDVDADEIEMSFGGGAVCVLYVALRGWCGRRAWELGVWWVGIGFLEYLKRFDTVPPDSFLHTHGTVHIHWKVGQCT